MSMMLGPGLLEGVLGAGGYPDPVEGVVLVDGSITRERKIGQGVSCRWFFDTLGQLQVLDDTDPNSYVYDGIQWHEEQPSLTTNPPGYYGIRATRTAYSGSGSLFSFSFYSLLSAPYSTGTPTPWRQLSQGQSARVERYSPAGTGIDTGECLIEICRWSDKFVLASATYEMSEYIA